MKLLKILFITVICVLISGCENFNMESLSDMTNDFPQAPDATVTEPAPDSLIINQFELDRAVNFLFKKNSRSDAPEYTQQLVNDSLGRPSLYIVNCKDGGYALISATKNRYPFLAQSESNCFEISDDMPPYLKEWFSNMVNNNYEQNETSDNKFWASFENHPIKLKRESRDLPHDEIVRLQNIYRDSLDSWNRQHFEVHPLGDTNDPIENQWLNEIADKVWIEYMDDWDLFTFVVERTELKYTPYGGIIDYPWSQLYDFNQSYPLLSNDEHAYVGCGPLAVGMIMRYYNFPEYFNWEVINKDLNPYYCSKTTSDMLYLVTERCNGDYKLDGTSTTRDDLYKGLYSLGFNVRNNGGSDLTDVHDSLYKGYPTIILSELTDSKDSTGGHGWVVSQLENYIYITYKELWTFKTRNSFEKAEYLTTNTHTIKKYWVNWGWGGQYNGYYYDLFEAPQGYVNNKIKGSLTHIKPYNK